jgi:hypothetical protein
MDYQSFLAAKTRAVPLLGRECHSEPTLFADV